MANSRGFTQGGVGRHLMRLGSYMAMGSVSMNASMFAEAFYLGLIGTQALAAMGVAFPVTISLFAFAGGIGTGASSVTARAMGAGDREGAALLITHSQLLALAVGIVLGFLGVVFARDMITLIGATGELRELTNEYLTVYLLGFPAFMLSIVGSTLLRATGNAKSPGIIMTAGSILQIVLGPPLIFGWFGIPALGIAGAAWAYVISRSLGMVLYVVLLLRARMLRWSLAGMLTSWRRIMHVGGPAVASGLVMPASMLVITRMLIGHGEAVVAGYNVASRVETLAHMILWSASSSVEPFVGQNWGARLYDRVKRALSLTHRFALVWGVVTFCAHGPGREIHCGGDRRQPDRGGGLGLLLLHHSAQHRLHGHDADREFVLQRARQTDAVAGDLHPARHCDRRAAGGLGKLPVRLRRHLHRHGDHQRRRRPARLAMELARRESSERGLGGNGVSLETPVRLGIVMRVPVTCAAALLAANSFAQPAADATAGCAGPRDPRAA